VARLRALPPIGVLAALVAASTLLRAWAAAPIPTPWIAPDELIYALLGRSLWTTGHLDLLGHPTGFFSFVSPAVAGLPLSLGDPVRGYALLKPLQSLVMSLAAVPVYLWGRTFLSRRGALAAAALALTIPSLAYSGLVMTEVAFYPVLLLAAWAIAHAVARATVRAQLLALAAIVLATATRLQAAALLPAYLTAVAFDALVLRDLRRALRFRLTAAGTALLGVLWVAYRLRHGGPFSKVLGAYQAAGEVHYRLADALRFVLYHTEALVLFTGVVPACALALLVVRALRTRESDEDVRAFLAVTTSLTVWLVVEVGLFASRHIGYLAERNLFGLEPLAFLALILWIERGLPRPRPATPLIAAAAVLLLVLLPMRRFVALAAIPDSFTLVPLWRLAWRPDLVVTLVGAVGALSFALVSRRWAWAIPAVLAVAFAATSAWASRVIVEQARTIVPTTYGQDRRWIDRNVFGPAAYLYTGDVYWNSVWENAFWNRRLTEVYDLLSAQVPGGIPQQSVGPYNNGELVFPNGVRPKVDYVVASNSVTFYGRRIATTAGISLWEPDPPIRLFTWTQNLRYEGTIDADAREIVYDCRGGVMRIRVEAAATRHVVLRRDGRQVDAFDVRLGESVQRNLAASPSAHGNARCVFDLSTDGPLHASNFAYEPPPG